MRNTEEDKLREKIHTMADYVQQRLVKKDYIVHRYNSFSTNSIYLKIDYGIGGTVRISDHRGKRHKDCRFNLEMDKKGKRKDVIDSKFGDRIFYTRDGVDRMIKEIVKYRENKVKTAGGIHKYLECVERLGDEIVEFKGFWSASIEIKRSPKNRIRKWLRKNGITAKDMDKAVQYVREYDEKIDAILTNTRNGWQDLDEHWLEKIAEQYYKPKRATTMEIPTTIEMAGEIKLAVNY